MPRIDGSRALTAESAAELGALCDRAGAGDANSFVIIRVSGVPGPEWSNDLPVALVSRWERGLWRLERLPAVTVAVADDDCSEPALDAPLVTYHGIMSAGALLVMLYRLARQAARAALARRAVLFGTPIGAAKARRWGSSTTWQALRRSRLRRQWRWLARLRAPKSPSGGSCRGWFRHRRRDAAAVRVSTTCSPSLSPTSASGRLGRHRCQRRRQLQADQMRGAAAIPPDNPGGTSDLGE